MTGGVPLEFLVVAGCLLLGLTLAALVSAWADRRVPYAGFVSLGVAGALFLVAHLEIEGGLHWRDLPQAFVLVLARLLN